MRVTIKPSQSGHKYNHNYINLMSKNKSSLEVAAGKLISSIQKEWGNELGAPRADISEDIMDKAHDILAAVKDDSILELLNGDSVSSFIGELWIKQHPNVKESISKFDSLLSEKY
jgi:hypothetical protein